MPVRGINKALIVGTVGADPELRYTPGGKAVVTISVATSESWKGQNGEKKEKTEWHRVVFFDRLAEVVGEYVRKGSKLYVEGKLQTSSWEKDGVKRYSTEIVASEMQMLDSARSTEPADTTRPAGGQGAGAPPPQSGFDNFDDDIPF